MIMHLFGLTESFTPTTDLLTTGLSSLCGAILYHVDDHREPTMTWGLVQPEHAGGLVRYLYWGNARAMTKQVC